MPSLGSHAKRGRQSVRLPGRGIRGGGDGYRRITTVGAEDVATNE
jgi:hypothetical protein